MQVDDFWEPDPDDLPFDEPNLLGPTYEDGKKEGWEDGLKEGRYRQTTDFFKLLKKYVATTPIQALTAEDLEMHRYASDFWQWMKDQVE